MQLIHLEFVFICIQCGVWFNFEPVRCNPVFRNDIESVLIQNGCHNFDEALPVTSRIVACKGSWLGHIQNAGRLCHNGFALCTWEDAKYLKEISWSSALQLSGCYAINAAQNGNQCLPCKQDSSSNDLAAVGVDCPYRSLNHSGCLSEGRISASTCNGTSLNRACSYVRQVTTGVLCCRRDDVIENVQMDDPLSEVSKLPVVHLSHKVGERVKIKCPINVRLNEEHVFWFKNGQLVDSQFSNTWFIKMAHLSDAGLYVCRINNSNSIKENRFNLTIVSVKSKACADGTSEGFHTVDHVRGCAGSWTGHIKRAERHLCGKGWKICSYKERSLIQNVDVNYLHEFGGCYAYNAAHINNKCRRCQNKFSMAALGRDCSVNEKTSPISRNRSSCYSNRIIQAYTDKFVLENNGGGCSYHKDRGIAGVLCCEKKKSKVHRNVVNRDIVGIGCPFSCKNGGSCFRGKCVCSNNYSGQFCQIAECNPACKNDGKCINGTCKCLFPYHGNHCQHKSTSFFNDDPIIGENQLEET